jgi:predicted RNase H-like HicB family nuclease
MNINVKPVQSHTEGDRSPEKLKISITGNYFYPQNNSPYKKVHIMREFTVVIEQDEDGIYVASVPELEGCHTQAETLDELNLRIKEAIELYLETTSENEQTGHLDLVGIQKIRVNV